MLVRPALATLAVLLSLTAAPLHAQTYPDRPIKIIVPSGPGGGYDLLARTLGPKLSDRLKQSIVVENRTGAGTLVGTQAAAAAPADGYTLVIGGPSNIVFNSALYKKAAYTPADFVPITLIINYPYMLITRADLPYASLAQFVAAARAEPGKFTMATAGVGTGQHIAAASFLSVAKIDMPFVHYKSAQQPYPDLLGGRVDALFDTVASARQHVLAGKARGLAMASGARSSGLPDVPTGRELGMPGFELDAWTGVFAPAKTPAAAVQRLRAEIAQTMTDADFRTRMEGTGGQLMNLSPQETEQLVRSEAERWLPLIRQAGIAAD